jgi:hypothetical protein
MKTFFTQKPLKLARFTPVFRTLLLIFSLSVGPFLLQAQAPLDATLSENASGEVFYVLLPDSNITNIELTLGSKSNLDDVFNNTFSFDQTSGLPSGLSWTRNGLQVYLGLGNLAMPLAYHARVRLKNTSGNWGDWYEFIGN